MLYEKIQQENGSIDFYICKEMFKYEISKHNVEKGISGSDIKNIEFSRVDDLLKKVQMNKPFYLNSSFVKNSFI